jgi:hypothetical protein
VAGEPAPAPCLSVSTDQNWMVARSRRLSADGAEPSEEALTRLRDRVVIEAADHISSFSLREKKSKCWRASCGVAASTPGKAIVWASW